MLASKVLPFFKIVSAIFFKLSSVILSHCEKIKGFNKFSEVTESYSLYFDTI